MYRKKGDYRKAETIYFSAISTLEDTLGKDHGTLIDGLVGGGGGLDGG